MIAVVYRMDLFTGLSAAELQQAEKVIRPQIKGMKPKVIKV